MIYEQRTIHVSKGLLAQLLEQHLDAIGAIKHNDQVILKFPWPHDEVPVELSKYKEQEVKVIKHSNGTGTT